MADKNVNATDAAQKRASEKGVDLSQVEPSGKDGKATVEDVEKVAAVQDQPVYIVNPALASFRAVFYDQDGAVREFFRDPFQHPDGVDAQRLSDEEAQMFSDEAEGLRILVPMGGGE